MFTKYSILIAEDFIGQYGGLAQGLERYGIPVLYCKNNSLDIRINIMNNCPSIVIFNSSLYDLSSITDIIDVVKYETYPPVMYNIYTYEDYERLMLLADKGIAYNIPTPYNSSAIAGHLKLLCENTPLNETDFKDIVHRTAAEILRKFGVSPSRTGFDYVVDGVMHILFSPRKRRTNFKNTVYVPIAQKRQVTVISVERAVRTIISNAWKRSDEATKRTYFPDGDITDKCPSNSDFTLQIADYIYNEHREYFDKYYSVKGY